MKRVVLCGLFACCALSLHAAGVSAQEVSGEAAARIEAACPSEAPAPAEEGRRLLIFTQQRLLIRNPHLFVAEACKRLGEKTGVWQTELREQAVDWPEGTVREDFTGFDAVCINNAVWPDDGLRASLRSYVREGGGLVCIHSAPGCFYERSYAELTEYGVRGSWLGNEFCVQVGEPDHPLAAMFPQEGTDVEGEICHLRDPHSLEELRVLLSPEVGPADPVRAAVGIGDSVPAVSWIQEYGKGRVFYCSLGSNPSVTWHPTVLRHFLAGVQYAMGDLEADATPSIYLAEDGWRDLFNGEDLTGWDCSPNGWHVEDGAIAWAEGAGFLWSKERFGNFILDLEFKVSHGANSGVMIRTDSRSNWLHTGIEVQLLDSYGRENPGKHDCGAIYDCLAPSVNAMKPAGEWNRMFVLCRDNVVRVVLNGHPIIDMDLDEWTDAHKNPDGSDNKFDIAYADMAREGFIGFQDHGHAVWFRNIRVRARN
jgi:type 1 glutamine amidotransferase